MTENTSASPGNRTADFVTDCAGIAGAGLISFGAHLIYFPLGYIVGGAFLLAGSWLTARKVG